MENKDQIDLIKQMENYLDGISTWNSPKINQSVDMMVAPHRLADFEEIIAIKKLLTKLKVDNVQKCVNLI